MRWRIVIAAGIRCNIDEQGEKVLRAPFAAVELSVMFYGQRMEGFSARTLQTDKVTSLMDVFMSKNGQPKTGRTAAGTLQELTLMWKLKDGEIFIFRTRRGECLW